MSVTRRTPTARRLGRAPRPQQGELNHVQIRTTGPLLIDIATRIIADDEDIFIVQPGEGYHLYDTFRDSKVVMLDFPDLKISPSRKPDRETLRLALVMSQTIRDWRNDGEPDPEPSRDLADYEKVPQGRRLGRYAGAIETLHYDLSPGSIIVVPGPGLDDPVLIGEIVGRTERLSWRSLYRGEKMLARRVDWIAEKPRAAFKPEIRAKFGTPNPIMQLERSLRDQIIRAAYDQFVFHDEFSSRLRTSKEEFSTLDDYDIQTFLNYAAGILAAIEMEREIGTVGSDGEIGFDEAIELLRTRIDLVPELTQSINSPGYQRLFSSSLTPVVIGTLLSMALSGDPSLAAQKPAVPQIVNSAAKHDDPCAIEVKARVERAMKLMKRDEWIRICKAAQSAKSRTGLSNSMQVERKAE